MAAERVIMIGMVVVLIATPMTTILRFPVSNDVFVAIIDRG